jgi:tetratricopeptide (TPR) repeat protein
MQDAEDVFQDLDKTLNKIQWDKTFRTAPRDRHAGRINPALRNAAEALRAKGDYQAAMEQLESDPDMEIDPAALNERGLIKLGLGDPQGALEDFDRSREIRRWQLATTEANRAAAFIEMQRYDDALIAAKEAIQIYPQTAPAWGNLLSLYALKVQLDEFFRVTEEMQHIWPGWKDNKAFLLFLQDNIDLRNARRDRRYERAFGKALQARRAQNRKEEV